MAELLEQRQRQVVDACTSINEHVSDRHSIQVSPDEVRLDVHARIFCLLDHGTFRIQRQLHNVFCWCGRGQIARLEYFKSSSASEQQVGVAGENSKVGYT
jgi:hypothetical protein